MGRIKELRAIAQRRTDVIYDQLFTRRFSIYFTAALAPLGVTANQVSVLAFIVGLAACALIAFGSPTQVLVGAGLVHLYAILDSVDGELARLRKQFSLKGMFIEDYSADSMLNVFPLAVGWYLERTGRGVVPLVMAIAFVAVGRNAMQSLRRSLLTSLLRQRPLDPVPAVDNASAPMSKGGARRLLRTALHYFEQNVLHYTNFWVVVTVLMAWEILVADASHLLKWVFIAFLALNLLKQLGVLFLILRPFALERELRRMYVAAAPMAEEALAAASKDGAAGGRSLLG